MDKQQVFYIHGGNAYSNYDDYLEDLRTATLRDLPGAEHFKKWSSSLAEDLGDGFEVFTPSMPNKQGAKYEEWKIWFERYFPHLKGEVILVGWSLGGYFLVKYLLENEVPFTVKALFLLAAPFENDDFGGEDGGDFAFDTSKVGELSVKTDTVYIFHSKDDPIVPFAHAEKYQATLPSARLISFTSKNHFLIDEFPELLENIKNC